MVTMDGTGAVSATPIQLNGDAWLDRRRHALLVDGETIELALGEWRLLCRLAEDLDGYVSDRAIYRAVYEQDPMSDSEARAMVRRIIYGIRHKLGTTGHLAIDNIPKSGYMLRTLDSGLALA